MRFLDRQVWAVMQAGLVRIGAVAGVAFLLALFASAGSVAREVTLKGAERQGFGRIALEFDHPTKVAARVSNGILIVSFAQPVTVRGERLAAELPAYVSVVRHDPDGTGLRLALSRPFRPNVLEAGERVFVDLLPESWTGLPPALPPEVVAELARRAQEAESKTRTETQRRRGAAPKPVILRVAKLPTLTRLIFTPPQVVPVSLKTVDDELELLFDAPLTLDAAQAKGQLAPLVRSVSAERGRETLLVKVAIEEGAEARGFREDEVFIVDVTRPKQASATPAPTRTPASAVLPVAAPVQRPDNSGRTPSVVTPAIPPSARPAAGPNVAPPENNARLQTQVSAPIRPVATTSPDSLKIGFPFKGRVAAAAFERGGMVTAVFHTPEPIDFASLPPEAQPFAQVHETTRDGTFAVVRLMLTQPRLVRLAPDENQWVLTIGETGVVPTEPLTVSRKLDESGRSVVVAPLREASGVYWLNEPQTGERLAVVTAFGGPRGAPKPQRFVEFRLLPTAHGLAIAVEADDMTVRTGLDGVSITRGLGLTVSLSGQSGEQGEGAQPLNPVISRDQWTEDGRGDVLARYRGMMHAVADAQRPELTRTRLDFARLLLANGFNAEAGGLLAFAQAEDPALLHRADATLLRGMAAARMERSAEARKILAADFLAEEPEAILWRAIVDTQQRRWPQALAGFRRSSLFTDLYPDDLQGFVRLQAMRAAVEARDLDFAEKEAVLVAQLPIGSVSGDELALLQARLEEAAGRPEPALETYKRLAETLERPIAAEAALHWITLALQQGVMPPAEAVARLETLNLIWRGDEIEIATVGHLGRLYAEAGRWRDAFTMARRANQLFPEHAVARALNDETSRLFEEIFLSGKADSLSRVDALALYFDFKEFTPIGRRGDEIVRRLADRMIELDLLDQAGDLLQHQVDNRLFGAARATVAARLATIRLMDNKPAQALSALQATRLPELPVAIKRARMLLEARALSDLSRTDLALEVLYGEEGPEIDRLRTDILWNGRRWREAGEAHERLVGTRWQGPAPLSDRDRIDVMRAAIAYSLGEEPLALDRLRGKFAAKMADSADARTFALVSQPNATAARSFRDIARSVTGADTLSEFLGEYRKRYPEAAAAERPRPALPAAPASDSGQPPMRGVGVNRSDPNG
jgi:tetratricopeptide (TPR) repeat protein